MNIPGLDYNTQREQLILPEYGREIQDMVDYCVTLADRGERQRCARTIVGIMERMVPQNKQNPDYKRKLWDHLAVMSRFKLDIDWPYDVAQARMLTSKPQPMSYPMEHIPVRHYGHLVFELFNKLKTMPEGRERDTLVRQVANQMKRDLVLWSHGSADNEKVAEDLARYTDGKIQLDLENFKFEKFVPQRDPQAGKKRKRK